MSDVYCGWVDGPNADNPAALYGLNKLFAKRGRICAVVDATAVNVANAPLGSRNDRLSREAHQLHTARIAGMFARSGARVDVWMGLDIAKTAITSPIPHSAHTSHQEYDIRNDGWPGSLGRRSIAGNFSTALSAMRRMSGSIHNAVGGPFSSLAAALRDCQLIPKIGLLAAQAGFEWSDRPIYSKMAFNAEVDLRAALEVFLYYPEEAFFVPSQITRDPAATFTGAEELGALGVSGEIYEMFLEHRKKTQERHDAEQVRRAAMGEKLKPYPALSIHDLQAVFALEQALGYQQGMFTFERIDPDAAIANILRTTEHWRSKGVRIDISKETITRLGYSAGGKLHGRQLPARWQVVSHDTALYKRRVPQALS